MVEFMQTSTAVLSLVAWAVAVAGAVVLVAARLGAGWALSVRATVGRWSMFVASAFTVVAMAGSLWFSEVAGYLPCELCWYQRIAMYPLAWLTTVAALRRDRRAAWYIVPLASAGLCISVWHWLIERIPSLSSASSCSVTVPCTVPWFTSFGFVTLAFMAASGFAGTVVLTLLSRHAVPAASINPDKESL